LAATANLPNDRFAPLWLTSKGRFAPIVLKNSPVEA
jgi:hypothetical protein